MKKSFGWLSLISMILNIVSYALFILFLNGGYYQTGLWYLWILLCVFTPIMPVVAKYYRIKKYQTGKAFEIIALVLSLFNFANLCTYGLSMSNGNLVGWAALIIAAIVYSKAIKEMPKEEVITEENQVLQEKETVKPEIKEQIEQLENNEAIVNKEILFCRKCGAKISVDSQFCQKCGAEVKQI